MASVDKKQTLPLLVGGMNLSDLSKGTGWIQNLNHYQGTWETRDGFGVKGVYDTQMLVKAPVPISSNNKGETDIGFVEVVGTYAFKTDFGHEQVITIVKTQGNTSVLSHDFPTWSPVDESKEGTETVYYTAIIYDVTAEEFLEEPIFRKTTEIETQKETQAYPTNPTPKEYLGNPVNVGNQHGAQESSYAPYRDYVSLYATNKNKINGTREYELKNLPSFFFFQYLDRIYFGSRELGTFYYTPCIFSEERRKRIDNYQQKDTILGYSETSVVKKVTFQSTISSTLLGEGYTYFTNSQIPTIIDACVWDERIVYLGEDKTIYYSQPQEGYAVIATDFDIVTSEEDVTGIAEVNGRLMIFTQSETFLLQPVQGQVLASGGRVTKISSTVGCASASAKKNEKGLLWWMDRNGAYLSNGSGDLRSISEPAIDKFFKIYIENAFTNYYAKNGWTTLSTLEQPRLEYAFMSNGLQTIYDDVRGHMVWNFTQMKLALIYNIETKEWYLWNFESVVCEQSDEVTIDEVDYTVISPTVGAKSNLKNMWLSFIGERLFGVFMDKRDIEDATTTFEDTNAYPEGNPSQGYYRSFPFYITEYGRGGSLDRSSILAEEHRKISSGYVKLDMFGLSVPAIDFDPVFRNYESAPVVYFEKGFWREAPFTTPSGVAYDQGSASLSDAIYWVPVSLQLQHDDKVDVYPVAKPTKIYMDFRFDKNHWTPVFNPTVVAGSGIYQLDIDIPDERLAISTAMGIAGATAGSCEIACYESTTGLTSATGDEIRVRINPTSSMALGSYYWYPEINIISYAKNRLFYLPFRRKIVGNNNAFSVGITACKAPAAVHGFVITRDDARDPTFDYVKSCEAYEWMETYTYPSLANTQISTYGGGNFAEADYKNEQAQSVDWLYKSPEIGDGKVGLKPRGTIAQLSSRGTGDPEIASTWSLGNYNILVSTNNKQYQGQILDYSPVETIPGAPATYKGITPANNLTADKETNITSILDNSTDSVVKKNFNQNGVVLGNTGDSTQGTYLVDSEIFVNKVTSDGTRGERFSYTLFGHMRNSAEKLFFKSVDAIYRVMGGVRRDGR